MKQTPSAIIILAATVLGACAVASLSNGDQNTAVFLTFLAVPTGIVGAIALIRACLYDYKMSLDAASRLEFLEELVYLERLSLERRERRRDRTYPIGSLTDRENQEDFRKKFSA